MCSRVCVVYLCNCVAQLGAVAYCWHPGEYCTAYCSPEFMLNSYHFCTILKIECHIIELLKDQSVGCDLQMFFLFLWVAFSVCRLCPLIPIFSFDVVRFIFYFCCLCFWYHIQDITAKYSMSWNFSLCFLSVFIVLAVTFYSFLLFVLKQVLTE
jgi:hypothetical protein